MNNAFELFSWDQGNVLIKLLIAHLLSDFVFQTKKMEVNEKWNSKSMFLHIFIVYILTALLTGWWLLSAGIAVIHYIIDGIKIEVQKKNLLNNLKLFIAYQTSHHIILLVIWALYFGIFDLLIEAIKLPFNNYQISLIILGYIIVSTIVGYIIKFSTERMIQGDNTAAGGKQIGIFERIIILTFVLLNQYEAIGFLITGKSIIRFVNKDEHIRSEYVLIGTMMSYAMSILVGVIINWLLKG
jgi:hypothetical protein